MKNLNIFKRINSCILKLKGILKPNNKISCNAISDFYNLDLKLDLGTRKTALKDINALRERMKTYISHAMSRIDYYDDMRKFFLQINLSLLIISSTLLTFIGDFLSKPENVDSFPNFEYVMIGFIFLWLGSFWSIFSYTWQRRTKFNNVDFWETFWFFRGHLPKKKNDLEKYLHLFAEKLRNIDEIGLLKDDIKQLFISFKYQSRRYRLLKENVLSTFIELVLFFIFGVFQLFRFYGVYSYVFYPEASLNWFLFLIVLIGIIIWGILYLKR